MRDIGVDRYLVAGQVVIDEEAEALVDDQFASVVAVLNRLHCAGDRKDR
jgi:hypothetical protein